MLRITYTSEASETIGARDIFRIVEQSAANNVAADLSGFLLFRRNRFFQVVEGEPPAIEQLMKRLERDKRHHSMTTLYREENKARSFARWRMKRFGQGQKTPIPEELARALIDAPAFLRQSVKEFLS